MSVTYLSRALNALRRGLCFASLASRMANRHALVIGNNYRGEEAELRSCFNDADEMSGAIERVGFSVTTTSTNRLSCKRARHIPQHSQAG